MTLQEAFGANQGTAILVPGGGAGNNGQCAQWADYALNNVYGFPYLYTPAAKDWWYNFDSFPQLANNFVKITDGSIKAGDFVIFDPLSGQDPQGHIDVASHDGSATDFWAYDSNWNAGAFHDSQGFPSLHEVHHTGVLNTKVLGSLRLKGNTMPTITPEALQDFENWKSYGMQAHNTIAECLKALNGAELTPAVLTDLVGWKAGGMQAQNTIAECLKALNGAELTPAVLTDLVGWKAGGMKYQNQVADLTKQVADLTAKLAANATPIPPSGTPAPPPVTPPDSVVVTKDSLFTAFLKFIGYK
jgi:hypothetical protein